MPSPDRVGEPAFAEPWQAQAFAMTMQLSKGGAFTWAEWVAVFSAEIRTNPAQPGEDSADAYYRQWLAALETILMKLGLSTSEEISGVQARWRRAYMNTPHGLPIVLEDASWRCGGNDDGHGDDDDHGHHHVVGVRQPIAISPAAAPVS